MATISFLKGRPSINVEHGSNLMKSLLDHNIPVASSCGGDGVCAKCKIQVIEGMDNLSIENQTEEFLKEKNSLASDLRISCQTYVYGDITIDTNYW